jgi:RNA polymerase sigma factor (sigma-70 family)
MLGVKARAMFVFHSRSAPRGRQRYGSGARAEHGPGTGGVPGAALPIRLQPFPAPGRFPVLRRSRGEPGLLPGREYRSEVLDDGLPAGRGARRHPSPGAGQPPSQPGNDHGGVVAASLGQPELFGEVYRAYFDPVHRYLAGRLGSDAADDLAAEVFMTAFRSRRSFDPDRGAVRPWLFGIATNMVARHRRTEARRYRALGRAAADPVADGGTERVLERVSAEQLQGPLMAALARLPARERDALLLGEPTELPSMGDPAPDGVSRVHCQLPDQRAWSLVSQLSVGVVCTLLREH